MKKYFPLVLVAAVSAAGWFLVQAADEGAPKPLRILLVIGGCCHEYDLQKDILEAGIESRIHADVVVEYTPDKSTEARFPIYERDDWAEGFDVVLHDECSANVTEGAYVDRILAAHREGIPAVNIHCAMHSYRWGDFREPVEAGADNAGWYEMIGLQSTSHGPKTPIDIVYTDADHPISATLGNWTTIDEELYNNVHIFDSAHPIATGRQMQSPKRKKGEPVDPDAEAKEVEAVVAWTNEYGPGKTRIFSTTIGHQTETVADDRYLDLVARGLLWATRKLNEDGTVAEGYGKGLAEGTVKGTAE